MSYQFPSEQERADRIAAEKLRFLNRGNFAVPANFVIACVVAFGLWQSFPHPLLIAWLAATGLVAGLRLVLYRRFLRTFAVGQCTVRWTRAFRLGAFTSGLLWGGLCLCLPVWGNADHFVFLMVVTTGLTAGALTSIVPNLQAYLAYSGSFILPLAAVSLMQPDPYIKAAGGLLLLFILVIGWAARNFSRSAIRTIELQVDNEILQCSLKQTRKERDAARREKWSTLAQLSHELRTPLNAILGFSEAMREQFLGPLGNDRYKDYAAHVHSSGQHLLTLTDEILQLSQGEAGELLLDESTFDLAEVASDCLDVMTPAVQKAEVTLKAVIPPELPLMRADETKVRQMLLNLVHNAIKFTTPHGEVTIEASLAPAGGIDLVVRDTGIGMRPEDIPLVLQPFGRITSSLKHEKEGAGLGLPICKRLAELHGAELTILSELGRGTTCRIAFPASRSIIPPDIRAEKAEDSASVAA